MNKNLFFALGIIAFSCFFMFCFNDDNDPSNAGKTVVGAWEEIIPSSPPFIPHDLSVQMIIEDIDSTFSFIVVEMDGANSDTLYKHAGTWEIGKSGNDSLILYGEECSMLDTSANPDTLMALPDSVCQSIIKLDTAITVISSDDLAWVIKMASLEPYMEALLPPLAIALLANMDLYMERKEFFIR